MAIDKQKTTRLIGALVLFGGAATALFSMTRGPHLAARDVPRAEPPAARSDVGTQDATNARLAVLERQIAALTATLAGREQELKDLGELTATRKREEANRARDAAEQAIPPRERAARALASWFQTLDQQLVASTPDPAWRPEAQAREVLNAVPGAQIVSVRCGPAHCRVELGLASEDDRAKLAEEIQAKPPFSAGVAYRNDPETPLKTVLYFQRPGVPLGEAS